MGIDSLAARFERLTIKNLRVRASLGVAILAEFRYIFERNDIFLLNFFIAYPILISHENHRLR